MNNLYEITDDKFERVIFQPRKPQVEFLGNMWHRNIILKSRQLGFSTCAAIFQLDCILFQPNILCGFICHTLPDAQRIFYEKVRRTYESLPDWLRAERPLLPGTNKMGLRVSHWSHGESAINVGTSLRGGTYSYIHVSELGKICAESAQKEAELVSGTLQAGVYCNITIESTAEGAHGFFHNTCVNAEKLSLSGKKLTSMDYKFFFYPWYQHDDCILPGLTIGDCKDIVGKENEYFNGMPVNWNQKAWYIKKKEELNNLSLMYREYPSTSEEAFRVKTEGAYFHNEIMQAYADKRIISHKAWDSRTPLVHVFDIGVGDFTAIWTAAIQGDDIFLIGYYENHGHGMSHYFDYLRSTYGGGEIVWPHDASVTEFGTGLSRKEKAWVDYGVRVECLPRLDIDMGIEWARSMFKSCIFYEPETRDGLEHLQEYCEDKDRITDTWTGKPKKSVHNHGADSFRYLATYRHLRTDERQIVDDKLLEENAI